MIKRVPQINGAFLICRQLFFQQSFAREDVERTSYSIRAVAVVKLGGNIFVADGG
jgi:hypothetical protein